MSLKTTSWARSGYDNNARHVVLATAGQRFWSRQLDVAFLLLIISFVSGVLSHYFPDAFSTPTNLTGIIPSFLFTLTFLMAMDAFCLAFFGQTFGRALAGIKVIKKSGRRLTLFEAFYRNMLVLIVGMFLYLPFLDLIAMLFAYSRISNGRETIWDESLDTYVISESASFGGTILTAVLTIGLILTISVVQDGFGQSLDQAELTASEFAR